MLMHSQVNLSNSTPWGQSLTKISELPVVGNRVLQLRVNQMSVQQLKQLIDEKASNILLIDVRYKSEYEMTHLPGAVLVPLPEIKSGKGIAKIRQLLNEKRQADSQEPIVIVICKAGIRSAKALVQLKEAGITGFNVTGGIHAWSQEIDSSVPQYSIKDIREFDSFLAHQRSLKQRWLTGSGLAVASFAAAAVFTVPHSSELKEAHIQATFSLEHISGLAPLSLK
ncbi:MAG TPA: rhodanese-like domain-containing protein [Candidatus Sericytochromatia bacterium]|jgi:rhodanese-related sulfurtransferase